MPAKKTSKTTRKKRPAAKATTARRRAPARTQKMAQTKTATAQRRAPRRVPRAQATGPYTNLFNEFMREATAFINRLRQRTGQTAPRRQRRR